MSPQRLYVVRHVKAASRAAWTAPDWQRPITAKGGRQAAAIAARLAGEQVTALVSSPFLRCAQSLEPLAARTGLAVVTDDRLAEGAPLASALELVGELDDRAVLCSHGDVIPDLVAALARRGMELTTEPDWRKATLWVLDGAGETTADGDPLFTTARVEPPPTI